jgi:hypothetical protein
MRCGRRWAEVRRGHHRLLRRSLAAREGNRRSRHERAIAHTLPLRQWCRIVFVDTVLRGIFGYHDGDRPPAFLQKCYPKADLLFAELRDFSAKLSYALDWQDGFRASPQLDVEFCNINNLVHFGRRLLQLREYDLIVVGHTAAGDDLSVLLRAVGRFDRRRAPLVVFIGNEYDILDDKIAFIRQTLTHTQVPEARHDELIACVTASGLDLRQIVAPKLLGLSTLPVVEEVAV